MSKNYLSYLFLEPNWYAHVLLELSLTIAVFTFLLAILLAAYRLFKGPTPQDRVLALDVMYINSMLLVMTYGVKQGEDLYFDVALLISLFGFVGTVAMAKFLLRGEVIES